jgi:hypothetical protein
MNARSIVYSAAVLLLAASVSSAQAPAPPPTPSPMKAPPPPPLPSMPAALTVPNPFGGLVPGSRDLYQSPDASDRFQQLRPPGPRPRGGFGGGGFGFGGVGYGGYGGYYSEPYYSPSLNNIYQPPPEIRGGLALMTVPDSAQVFVDGFYVGLTEEFGAQGRPMTIAAGVHRIELRAPGYETLSFSVVIDPHAILRYRGDMTRLSSTPAAVVTPPPVAQQPAVAKNYYVIPKCYAGDKPPKRPLPAGCDAKNLQTYK